MNKQLSVMGLAARASMVPVLIASGLTALAVGALTYLANPEHTQAVPPVWERRRWLPPWAI